jgi:hypothetical protein
MSLNTNTGLALVNTQSNSGTLTLPDTLSIPGRIITFKDSMGTFEDNPLILATQSTNTIDLALMSSFQTSRFGWTTLVGGPGSSWYQIGGTEINSMSPSTLIASSIQTAYLRTALLYASSLIFQDLSIQSNTGTLFPSSTSLYYTTPSTTLAVAGGPRQSFGTQFVSVQ